MYQTHYAIHWADGGYVIGVVQGTVVTAPDPRAARQWLTYKGAADWMRGQEIQVSASGAGYVVPVAAAVPGV